MKWSIHRGSSTLVELFTGIGGILLLLSLVIGDGKLFFAAAILLVFGIYPRWYLNYIGKHFSFQNEREKIHLSQGEQGELRLVFSNGAKLPIVFSTVEFSIDDLVHVGSVNKWIGKQYQFELSIKSNHKETFVLPVEALTRGIAKMKLLKIKIYDPMRLASFTLTYDFLRKVVVIYPQRKPINGLDQLMLPIEGVNPHQTSIFQDLTSPIGTREYIPSDPLKYVNWKASARTGKLQTKVFEKTMGMSWTIVILLDREITKESRIVLEEQLSYVAFICSEAQKRGVDTEIFINFKPMGRSMVYHMEPGHDRIHFIKAMEFLALINIQHIKTLPMDALKEIDRGFQHPHVIMLIDHSVRTDKTRFYKKWQRNGHAIYHIDPEGFIAPLNIGGERLVN